MTSFAWLIEAPDRTTSAHEKFATIPSSTGRRTQPKQRGFFPKNKRTA